MALATDFVVGLPRCNEPMSILTETLDAIRQSSVRPSTVFVIDNGDAALELGCADAWNLLHVDVVRPGRNLGCAGAWNLLHDFAGDRRMILLNADCAVATDTFERMLTLPEPAVVLGFGFGCFRIDSSIREQVGAFDAEFYPAYFEDADYRYRMKLAGIVPIEWRLEPLTRVTPGRDRSPDGITHGSHDPDGYQGWRGNKLGWFWTCYENNRKRFLAKWGGEPGHETFTRPFDQGAP